MLFAQSSRRHAICRGTFSLTPLAFFWLAAPVFGEQEYVTRHDASPGHAFLSSPHIGLWENGFAVQAGFRPTTWYSAGFDYSYSTGDTTLTPDLLPSGLRQTLSAQLAQLAAAGLLPPGYQLRIPVRSRTHTFAVGPPSAISHM